MLYCSKLFTLGYHLCSRYSKAFRHVSSKSHVGHIFLRLYFFKPDMSDTFHKRLVPESQIPNVCFMVG
jgi:hypothetical protein